MKKSILAASLMMAVLGMGQAAPPATTRGGAAGGSEAQPVAVLLEQGIYQEETAGNLEAAAKTYQQIASQAVVTRSLVAQSLYRLAVVQMKQKQVAAAQATVEMLQTQYPEQKELIGKAQGVLPAVAGAEVSAGGVAPGNDAGNGVFSPQVPPAEDKAQAAALVKQGWQRMQERDFAQAEKLFSEADQMDNSAEALVGYGWAKMNSGNAVYGEVESIFKGAIERDPKNAKALNGLGWALKNAERTGGKVGEAPQYWLRAVEADPTATSAISGLAQYAADRGQYEDAIAWYDKWLKIDPENADAKIGINAVKQTQAAVKDATAAVNEFLKCMDAGQYAESYKLVSPQFSGAANAQLWEETCKASVSPLGKVVTRKVDQTQPNMFFTAGGFASGGGGGGGFSGGGGGPSGRSGRGGRGGTTATGGLLGRGVDPGTVAGVAFQFVTEFEHKKDVFEIIQARKSDTGEWQVVSYSIDTPRNTVDPLRAR